MPSSQRAARETLTREAVVSRAVEMVRAAGSETLSIRSVAAELGVTPMALYRHVHNKDDLLDEVVDVMFDGVWRPAVPRTDWRRWIVEVADRFRRFLVEQPAALHLYLRHPVVSPSALRRMDACLEVLTGATADAARAGQAYAAIQTYTIGFAALEASRDAARAAAGPRSARDAHARVRELAAYTTPEQFVTGLDLLLRGVDSTITRDGARG